MKVLVLLLMPLKNFQNHKRMRFKSQLCRKSTNTFHTHVLYALSTMPREQNFVKLVDPYALKKPRSRINQKKILRGNRKKLKENKRNRKSSRKKKKRRE